MLSGFCPGCLLDTVLATEPAKAPGSRIEDYELLNEVARGGMGIVYRAHQRVPSRVVALKMILPAHLNSLGAVTRFRAEAEAAATLDHESILPIYAVGEHDGAPFYSMKFAEGGPLSARIDGYPEKPREAAALIAKLARALAYAHEHGLLHRDLKPANVLFDSAGKPYVSDFGLAKWLQRECDLTQTLAILGTPLYMAPEQATDSRAVTAAADVYSLGAILYHLLEGRPPVSGESPMEVLQRANTERPRLTNRRAPRDLATICLKCLEKEPAARYESAAALAEDLERFCSDRPILARPIGLTNRAWRWSRRNPVLAGLSATTVALVIAIATLVPLRREMTKSAAAMKAVAVLPFDHPGADQTGELLASGLQDDILVSLSKIAGLKVISRNSVARYAGRQTDPGEIGRALKVDAVLVGSLRQTGKQARINVELLRVADGTQMWAESFDREINDVLGIQSDLTLQIASALKATVLPIQIKGIRRRPTYDTQAYLRYVQASDLFADPDRSRAKLLKAEQLLQQAIERDPKFALAFALYSQVEAIFTGMYDSTPERLQKTRTLAEQALQLDPDLPQAHIAMGRYLWQARGRLGPADFAGARREFETALRTLPGNAELRSFIGRIEMQQGQWNEARANLEQAAALDPLTPERWNTLFGVNYQTRRYPAALEAMEHEIALMPNSWRCEWQRALILMSWKGDLSGFAQLRPQPTTDGNVYHGLAFETLMLLRRYDKAEAMVREDARQLLPGFDLGPMPKSLFFGYICEARKGESKAREYLQAALPFAERAVAELPWIPERHMALGELYASLGRNEDAIREGKRGCELLPESRDAFSGALLLPSMAHIYMKVGETKLALDVLEHSLSRPAGAHVGDLRADPRWDPLLNDPRFQQLVVKYAPRE